MRSLVGESGEERGKESDEVIHVLRAVHEKVAGIGQHSGCHGPNDGVNQPVAHGHMASAHPEQ